MLKQKYIKETRRKLLHSAQCASPMSHTLQQVKGRSKHIKDDSGDACVRGMAWKKRIGILILASLLFAGEFGILKHMNH